MSARCLARAEGQIPADLKADYLKALISAGFKHIDAVSFVSPKAVPQMADSEEVLKELDPPDDVEIIGIVVNEKGAERAIADTGGFHSGISLFDFANVPAQEPEPVTSKTRSTNWKKSRRRPRRLDSIVVVYISMAFGNPYGDPWNVGEVMERRTSRWKSQSANDLFCADTVGMAEPAADRRFGWCCHGKYDYLEIGVAFAQPSGSGRREDFGRVRCGLPPLRFRARRPGRMSLRARCARGEHPDGNKLSKRSANGAPSCRR